MAPIELGVILDERENRLAVGGEIRDFVWFGDDDLPIQNVVVSVVAAVDDKREVHHKTGGVALTVGAGIWLIGRQAVVDQKLCVVLAVDDKASAGAFHIGGDIFPAAHKPKIMVLVFV